MRVEALDLDLLVGCLEKVRKNIVSQIGGFLLLGGFTMVQVKKKHLTRIQGIIVVFYHGLC